MKNAYTVDESRVPATEPITVPYVVYSDRMWHDRWVIKWLVRALIVTIILLFVSNAIWLYAWNQYDYSGSETEVVTTVDSEGDGVANYTGHDGGVMIGEGDSPQDNADENEN